MAALLSAISKLLSSLGFAVKGMLLAETAILAHFQSVGIVFLVLHRVVVSLLALVASQSNLHAHLTHLLIRLGCPTARGQPFASLLRSFSPPTEAKSAQKKSTHSQVLPILSLFWQAVNLFFKIIVFFCGNIATTAKSVV